MLFNVNRILKLTIICGDETHIYESIQNKFCFQYQSYQFIYYFMLNKRKQ